VTPKSGLLPIDDLLPGDLDALLEELDAALDASFLGDVRAALERAAAPPADSPAAA
jgi:hypothetical protein